MKIKEIILNVLLDKYEKSKSYTENTSRRIIVKMSQISEYKIEEYEQKELWNSVLIDLKKKKFIGFSWEKFEENNIVKEVWLIKENISEIYSVLNRKNPKEDYQIIMKQLEKCIFHEQWLIEFQKDMVKSMIEKQKANILLPLEVSNEIIQALKEIDAMQNKSKNSIILKRVFSMKCYHDSKYFEKNIEKKLVRIVRKYMHLEELNDNEVLAEIGIVKYPEIIEFCGDITCIIKGKKIPYASITKGSYINGNTVNDIETILLTETITKVIFIENKANYIAYIQNKKTNELVIYHGGFYSPVKGEFFKKVYKSLKNDMIEFYHWSDIDIGGFEIFVRLRDNIVPELKPLKMDVQTLLVYKSKTTTLEEEYYHKLAKLKEKREFEIFWPIIDVMLENNIKLEQEAIIEEIKFAI